MAVGDRLSVLGRDASVTERLFSYRLLKGFFARKNRADCLFAIHPQVETPIRQVS